MQTKLLPATAHIPTPSAGPSTFDFELPTALEASEPPEVRGLARDTVRLMVSRRAGTQVQLVHTTFRALPDFVNPGDVLVINTSGTLNAALPAVRSDGLPLEVHLSTHLPVDLWVVEVRLPTENATQPFFDAEAGETLRLPGRATITLLAPYQRDRSVLPDSPTRLWVATLHLSQPLQTYLAQHGFPIRYGYVKQAWPSSYYQTAYVTEMGSAEMPSAGRAFTPELITRLIARGVLIVPLILHTGVASLEAHESPYEEFYRVPAVTARVLNSARAAGRCVIAVGTTVVRALETVTDAAGTTHPGEGWTDLVITPARKPRAIDGLLTGLHAPRASHLALLEALAGREHLQIAYAEALHRGYRWHEFGDLHLILP